MAESFLVLWSQKRLEVLERNDELGDKLKVIYGSPHSSAPSLRRYGVSPKDTVFVVGVKSGAIHLVARAKIKAVVSVDDYLRDHLGLSPKYLDMHLWDLSEALWKEHPELGHRLPFGCVNEAGVVASSSPIALDEPIPMRVLSELRFRTKRGDERGLPLKNGKLRSVTSIQGHYFRLTPETAKVLDRLAGA